MRVRGYSSLNYVIAFLQSKSSCIPKQKKAAFSHYRDAGSHTLLHKTQNNTVRIPGYFFLIEKFVPEA